MIEKTGHCNIRHSPNSTFKIALSLMGYDSGFLMDETHPELSFKEGYVDWLDQWKQPHNPQRWIKNSCVWYSQCLTNHLGMSQFKRYIQILNYGNQDASGDKGQRNGLTHAWLSSSLQISPEEQLSFLEKLLLNEQPVSHRAQQYTRNILFVETLQNGWKLFGKTGNGFQQLADGSVDKTRQAGWFVGWVEKGEQALIFVQYIEDERAESTYASLRAKAMAKAKVIKTIQASM